jgi:hypothetical protein
MNVFDSSSITITKDRAELNGERIDSLKPIQDLLRKVGAKSIGWGSNGYLSAISQDGANWGPMNVASLEEFQKLLRQTSLKIENGKLKLDR